MDCKTNESAKFIKFLKGEKKQCVSHYDIDFGNSFSDITLKHKYKKNIRFIGIHQD
jgi:hypothetical protein